MIYWIYFKGIGAGIIAFFGFGVVAPFLISQNDDLAVGLGFAIIFGIIPILFILIKSMIKNIIAYKKKGEKK